MRPCVPSPPSQKSLLKVGGFFFLLEEKQEKRIGMGDTDWLNPVASAMRLSLFL
jgi:hypothetical protein